MPTAALAGGNGAQTMTEHLKGAVMDIGPDPCPGTSPNDLLVTVNAVNHGTVNNNGSWFTTTLTGSFTDGAGFTGHVTGWFGDENNQNVEVQHGTFDAHGTLADGTATSFHENMSLTQLANGTITATHDDPRCG